MKEAAWVAPGAVAAAFTGTAATVTATATAVYKLVKWIQE